MKIVPFLLFGFCTVVATADLIMVQEMDMPGRKFKMVMSIKDKLVRVDYGDETSLITNTESGEVISLNHGQKLAYTEVASVGKSATVSTPKEEDVPQKPPFVATGQKEKVGDYDCEIYTVKIGGNDLKVWVAKDGPGIDEAMKLKAALKKVGGPIAVNDPDVPGLPLKSEITAANGNVHKLNLISFKETPVDEKIFTAPSDYIRKVAGP